MKLFDFKLITPDEVVFEAKVSEVILPTELGEIGILADHEPLITLLKPGEIRVKTEQGEMSLASMGGFAEITGGKTRVLSDSAVKSEKIDAIAAEEARKRAQESLEQSKNDQEIAEASAALERALLHIKIAGRKRRHH